MGSEHQGSNCNAVDTDPGGSAFTAGINGIHDSMVSGEMAANREQRWNNIENSNLTGEDLFFDEPPILSSSSLNFSTYNSNGFSANNAYYLNNNSRAYMHSNGIPSSSSSGFYNFNYNYGESNMSGETYNPLYAGPKATTIPKEPLDSKPPQTQPFLRSEAMRSSQDESTSSEGLSSSTAESFSQDYGSPYPKPESSSDVPLQTDYSRYLPDPQCQSVDKSYFMGGNMPTPPSNTYARFSSFQGPPSAPNVCLFPSTYAMAGSIVHPVSESGQSSMRVPSSPSLLPSIPTGFLPHLMPAQYGGRDILLVAPNMSTSQVIPSNSNGYVGSNGSNGQASRYPRIRPHQFLPTQPQPSSSAQSDSLDRKAAHSNQFLVRLLTTMNGLRSIAPGPSSPISSTTGSRNDLAKSEAFLTCGERKRRTTRASNPVNKKEARPKIFDIEQFTIGGFTIRATVNERRNYSAQLRVVFDKRRLIYEFALPAESTNFSRGASGSVVYYVISVPFEFISGLNIEGSVLCVVIDRAPYLFGGSPVKSRVHFQKEPVYDPSLGELDNNALHIIHIKSNQIGRLRNSLKDFDIRFADMLATPIDIDPGTYRYKLPKPNEEDCDVNKELSSDRVSNLGIPNPPLKRQRVCDLNEPGNLEIKL